MKRNMNKKKMMAFVAALATLPLMQVVCSPGDGLFIAPGFVRDFVTTDYFYDDYYYTDTWYSDVTYYDDWGYDCYDCYYDDYAVDVWW